MLRERTSCSHENKLEPDQRGRMRKRKAAPVTGFRYGEESVTPGFLFPARPCVSWEVPNSPPAAGSRYTLSLAA